ncbi:hypothetical protein KGQ64_17645, partial [bacterium]|nr:hypothetical protein [bacterium]
MESPPRETSESRGSSPRHARRDKTRPALAWPRRSLRRGDRPSRPAPCGRSTPPIGSGAHGRRPPDRRSTPPRGPGPAGSRARSDAGLRREPDRGRGIRGAGGHARRRVGLLRAVRCAADPGIEGAGRAACTGEHGAPARRIRGAACGPARPSPGARPLRRPSARRLNRSATSGRRATARRPQTIDQAAASFPRSLRVSPATEGHAPRVSRSDVFAHLDRDLPAGLVVFLVATPLCLGIAQASGAPLLSGLVSGIVGGIVVSSISHSALSVSGPAAGLAVIVASGIDHLGFRGLLLATMLAGLIQVAVGLARFGDIA